MLCPPHPPAPVVENWLERHRHPASFLLHLVGIPLTIVGVLLSPIALISGSWPILGFSLGLFVGGYAFQLLGHVVDRSEPGEWTAIKSRLNRRAPASDASRLTLISGK